MRASEDESAAIPEDAIAANIGNLINRAKILLGELEAFQTRLRTLRPGGTFAISRFRDAVKTEHRVLDRGLSSPDAEFSNNVSRGSNLPFFEHVWSVAKNSRDVVGLPTRWISKSSGIDLANRVQRLNRDERALHAVKDKILIDVISDGGKTWKKVSLTTTKRLLFDLAKQGWQSEGSDESDGEAANGWNLADDQDVPLLKTAKELVAASKRARVLTMHPRVEVILPRLERGHNVACDRVLTQIEAYGVTVLCKDDVKDPPSIQDALAQMVRDQMSLISAGALNIDCTILLALVSDLSHSDVYPRAWFHEHLRRQIEREMTDRLLPSTIYPVLGGRKLVCTTEAANRMREIAETLGTPSEKARTEIIFGDNGNTSTQQLVEDMQGHSTYPVPQDLQLPIFVVDQNENDCQSHLPANIINIGTELSAINQSVFMYGWATGMTTITSNRSAIKKIETELEKLKDVDETLFPSIWVCPVARSLVGKEKRMQELDDAFNTPPRGGSIQEDEEEGQCTLDGANERETLDEEKTL